MSLEQNILSTGTVVDKTSADDFLKGGIPSRKDEEYKFTDLKKVIEKKFSFQPFQQSSKDLFADLKDRLPSSEDAYRLVYLNGALDTELSSLPSALTVEALTNNSRPGSKVISALREKSSHEFVHDNLRTLNEALASNGAYIIVGSGVVIEKPVYIIYLADASVSESYIYPKLVIEHAENSQAQYVEISLTAGSKSSLINANTEIYLDQNAVIDYYSYQNDTDASVHIKNTVVFQNSKSNFSAYTITIGGGVVRNNLNIALVNERIESNMFGLYMLNGDTHVDNHTVVDHQYPNCLSNELYKGVLAEKSRGVFNGKIFVREDAQQTNAFQSNNNIVISDKAVVNTKPQLEIWADDVKCSHGCTVGQLDEDAIFYMQARGVDKDKAQSLLLQAFAADVIEKVKIESLKDFLIEKVNERLG